MKPGLGSTAASESASRVIEDFRNEPPTDASKGEVLRVLLGEVAEARREMPFEVPLLIGAQRLETGEKMDSLNPCRTAEVVAVASCGQGEHGDQAVAAARKAYGEWSRTSAEERARVLLRGASIMRERKFFLCAVALLEAGKAPREAIADIDEAIDFLEYYAREAMRLGRPRRLQPYLVGETNDYVYAPLGVVAVIGPWNFPLAIPVGMSSAAIATGNAVVLKPAEQTPLIASLYMQIMKEAGLPDGVLNLLPGRGEVVGARLVSHPDVNMIVFTGSREVGVMITREAAIVREGQHFVKRVVTEMGGKNAIIVDESADMDRSIADVLYSAFGFSGQKCSACSRLIVDRRIYDEYVHRLVEAAGGGITVGEVEEPSSYMGAVIDGDARDKVLRYQGIGRDKARTLYIGDVGDLAGAGFFVPPAIYEVGDERHCLMQDEIFGPVLAVCRADGFEDGLRIANSTPYALTGGVHSASRANLELARQEYQAGNLYLNRTITGAIVGRQPFGGFRLSGIGTKAGGPDYLRQFMVTKAICERTD